MHRARHLSLPLARRLGPIRHSVQPATTPWISGPLLEPHLLHRDASTPDVTGATSATLPQFLVGTYNGFLPRSDPLTTLPTPFKPVDNLLQPMPLMREDGTPGG